MLSFAPQSGYGMSKDMASLAAVAQANSISLQASLRSSTASLQLAAVRIVLIDAGAALLHTHQLLASWGMLKACIRHAHFAVPVLPV